MLNLLLRLQVFRLVIKLNTNHIILCLNDYIYIYIYIVFSFIIGLIDIQ
jgi:hypothetical protein